MFDRIAGSYDRLNHLFSLRIDVAWRRRMLRYAPPVHDLTLLDIATGTADVLLTFAKRVPLKLGTGIDMSQEMMALGREKITKAGFDRQLVLLPGNAQALPLRDGSADLATISFGIRNIPDVPLALREMHRVLRKDGRLLVLEFSLPSNVIIRNIYLIYFRFILPKIGGWLSGNPGAYGYLNRSVEDFPYGAAFKRLLLEAGFDRVCVEPLTFGIATLYIADKQAV